MEQKYSSYITQLIYLNKTKRDGLICLDGRWGTGKTHFLLKIFSTYHQHTTYHISLLGVNSLNDFKTKIINSYYLNDTKSLSESIQSISGVISISSGSPASANVINNIISSISSSVREKIISNLSGLFVIDDLERIKDDLRADVLSYCHSLYTQNTSSFLDFIVVTNTSSESSIKIEHKEKVISDHVVFTPSLDDVFSIEAIKDKTKNFPLESIELVKDLFHKHSVINLRLIIRALNKIEPIIKHLEDHPQYIWKVPFNEIASSIVAFFLLYYVYNVKLEDILSSSFYSQINNKGASPLENEAWSLFNSYRSPKTTKEYCLGFISINDYAETVFSTPTQLTTAEVALCQMPHYEQVDETALYDYFHESLTNDTKIELHFWIKILFNYRYLTRNLLMPRNLKITEQALKNRIEKFTDDEVDYYFNIRNGYNATSSLKSDLASEPVIVDIFNLFIIRSQNKIINEIKNTLTFRGWCALDVTILDKIAIKSKYRPLELLTPQFIAKCIHSKFWSVKDIYFFECYIKNLYNFSNIGDYLANEKPHLIYLNSSLNTYLRYSKPSFRHGVIHSLSLILQEIIDRL